MMHKPRSTPSVSLSEPAGGFDMGAQPPLPFDIALAQTKLAMFVELASRDERLASLAAALQPGRDTHDLISGLFGCSPFLTELCFREPDVVAAFVSDDPRNTLHALCDEMRRAMRECADFARAMAHLRIAKRRIALLVALCDLGGRWGSDEVTHALSLSADALISEAVDFLFRQAASSGQTEPGPGGVVACGYIVLAMGKHGAFELNYSSDIDLIVFFDPERMRLRKDVEPGSFFIRMTKDLVKLLQERTADGYVFRTDLRLRPDPSSTQVAISVNAAFHYYESAGQNWERAAFIKARPVAGDIAAGEAFLKGLTPYIWRKYLDYAAIADIHAMKRQIHAHKGHREVVVAGHNLKLGRGGIREIEFFVQTQQLIAGGRQPDLRVRGTLEGLNKLAEKDWITATAAAELSECYRVLRRIEHRLQMINDEQTHTLPADDAGLLRVARFSGYEDRESFADALARIMRRVETHYARLFEAVPELTSTQSPGSLVFTGTNDDPETLQTLQRMGFESPSSVIATVRGWHYGRYPAMRSAKARERLTEITPRLLEALAATSNPNEALTRFDIFLSELPAGLQLFSLLKTNPDLLQLVADIMGSAPRLARILSSRRKLLDAVLDPGIFEEFPETGALIAHLREEIGRIDDYEEALNRARVIGQEKSFIIGVSLLTGVIDAARAGEAYAGLAEGMISALQMQVEQAMRRAHGDIPGAAAAVIGMGKLGGREMTAASDLDLILVYDYPEGTMFSSGLKPLAPSQYYARFTQRLISALSAATAEGRLYEVDMRLRPSGNAGPVATSLASFSAYQKASAWTWEHMALTRARVVSGDSALARKIEGVVFEALTKPRDPRITAKDVRDMRARIAEHKAARDRWDLKLVRGGLIDIEFIAQYLQLLHGATSPQVLKTNTAEALMALREAGHLDADATSALLSAVSLYGILTQITRLCIEGPFDAKASEGLKIRLARAAGAPDFSRLEAELSERQESVARLFEEIVPAA